MGANTSDADKLQGLGRGRGRGSQLLIKQSPNAAGYVVWGDFYFDAAAGGVDGTVATSQAQSSSLASNRGIGATTATEQGQSVAATAARTINATAATSQAQSTTGTAQRGIESTAGTSQGQSSQATANGVLDGVIGSAQGQTVEAFADTAITVDATISTSQAQSTNADSDSGSGETQSPHGFEMRTHKRVYIKRGKQYLIFNTLAEADSYVAAEEAIETARQSSRGAARRKVKALNVPKPEVVQAVEPEKLEVMLERFNLPFNLSAAISKEDFAALHYIQEQLAIMQDDEDIELLLLTL